MDRDVSVNQTTFRKKLQHLIIYLLDRFLCKLNKELNYTQFLVREQYKFKGNK